MNISSDDKELRHSIRLLDSVLTQVLKTQARPGTAATVEQLQQRFAGLLRDSSQLRAVSICWKRSKAWTLRPLAR